MCSLMGVPGHLRAAGEALHFSRCARLVTPGDPDAVWDGGEDVPRPLSCP